MNLNEAYKKIPWVNQMPNIFINGIISGKRLDSFQKDDQSMIMFQVISSLNRYFGQMPGNPDDMSMQDFEKAKENFANILEVWLDGLCDLSISQIINGLVDILNLKTEYQKWPPKSVMEFYAVCKSVKPAYHEPFKKNENFKQIGCDEKPVQDKKNLMAIESLNNIYKTLGINYREHLVKRIKSLEKNKIKSKKTSEMCEASKNSLGILNKILGCD